MSGYSPESGPMPAASLDRLATVLDEQCEVNAVLSKELARISALLAESLDGWARACDVMHRACCLDQHAPDACRDPRIAEIRREGRAS